MKTRVETIAGLLLICCVLVPRGMFAEGLSREQENAILNELRQIKTLVVATVKGDTLYGIKIVGA